MLLLNKYGYLILYSINIVFSFYLTELNDFYPLIGLFALYISTTILFGLDWLVVSFRFKLPEDNPMVKSVHLLTHMGDRIMFLAITAVSDVLIFALSLPDPNITFLENALHIPLFIVLIGLFLIPWFILYIFGYRYIQASEKIIYIRFRTAILNNSAQIPPEILPYFVPGLALQTPLVPRNLEVPKYNPSNQELVLYAYPSSSQESSQTTDKLTSSDKTTSTSTYYEANEAKTRVLEAYNAFLSQIYPELQPYIERNPVAIQNTLILAIIAQRISTDPELLAKISSLTSKLNF